MTKCYLYLRTSGDDGKLKAGIPVHRDACTTYAKKAEFEIVGEFVDDGVTGTKPMYARPQGKLLIAALLADGVKTVLCYDAKRIGRTQPAFWSFAGLCRENGIALLASDGTDLLDSVQGGVNGMLAEMDRNAIVARLAAGKKVARAKDKSKRLEGRWPYGQHPSHEHDDERKIVARIEEMHAKGMNVYRIVKTLNTEGVVTRTGKKFRINIVNRILERGTTNA